MFQFSLCAFLAPALVSAAAFPWGGPEPTLTVPQVDTWSPATTPGPKLGEIELLRRDDDNTCGYISGNATLSLTCNNSNYVCATNTYYGVHGCCNPNGIATCSIPTTCIPSASLSASCTGDCLTNEYVTKCSDSGAPFCYEWRYIYDSTIMTEFGCASEAFTQSVERTISGGTLSLPSEKSAPTPGSPTSSSTATTSSSSSSSSTTSSQTETPTITSSNRGSKTNVAAIAGGVVGGVAVLGAAAFGIVFLILRNRRNRQNAANTATGANQPFIPGSGPMPGVGEFKPQQPGAYPASPQQYPDTSYYGAGAGQEGKAWQGQQAAPIGVGVGGVGVPGYGSPPTSPSPQYPGQPIVQEAGGTEVGRPGQQGRLYEAP